MMPVIRISEATYNRLQKHAKPFEDTPDSVIAKALTALDMVNGDPEPFSATSPTKTNLGPKLPQREFRIPLLVTLLEFGGKTPAKAVRERLERLMAARLSEADYASVSTGDPRWWNAVCWERSELVKDGLMRDDSERGVWEIGDAGKALPASFHRKENGTDRMIEQGTLEEMARKYHRVPVLLRGKRFLMVGDTVFQENTDFRPILLTRISNLEFSLRTFNCCKNDGIVYVGDLVQRSEAELLRTPNFGRKSLVEIKDLLRSIGLALGMEVPDWPPANVAALADAYQEEAEG